MNEEAPLWFPILLIAGLIGIGVLLRRLELRQQARRQEEALRKLVTALGAEPDERHVELLRYGLMPWYEFPRLTANPAPPRDSPGPPGNSPAPDHPDATEAPPRHGR